IGEDRIALDVAGVGWVNPGGVGEHRHHAFTYRFWWVAEINAIAQGFRHLGTAVSSGQTGHRTEHRSRLDEHLVVQAIESAHDLARLLDHRQLIFTDRDQVSLEDRDVRSLGDRVGPETDRHPPDEIALFDLFLDCRITFQRGN